MVLRVFNTLMASVVPDVQMIESDFDRIEKIFLMPYISRVTLTPSPRVLRVLYFNSHISSFQLVLPAIILATLHY